jgi:hypothetical protein
MGREGEKNIAHSLPHLVSNITLSNIALVLRILYIPACRWGYVIVVCKVDMRKDAMDGRGGSLKTMGNVAGI